MFDVPKPQTENRQESIWDHHGSYQWTYFEEFVKKRISFFLSQRLNGKNIELGGGWYLSHPNSTVVDLSSICLKHNPAKEKLQFDLDVLGKGEKLPYKDNSFESATMVSVWQYLSYPEKVLSELQRILVPGGEVYIINGQGAGLEGCVVNSSTTSGIHSFFTDKGYDTLIESIPVSDERKEVKEFQSICVAMPGHGLFGEIPSGVKNKASRIKQNEEIQESPYLFNEAFVDWEFRIVLSKLSKLSTFPITKYSQEYLKKVEEFSQEYNKISGNTPIIYMGFGIAPNLLMATPDKDDIHGRMMIMTPNGGYDKFMDAHEHALMEKFGLRFGGYSCSLNHKSIPNLLDYCENFVLQKYDYANGRSGNEHELSTMVEFLSSIPLNSFAKELQKQMMEKIYPRIPDMDLIMGNAAAHQYHFSASEHKQKRSIDKLIEKKEKIISEGIPVIGEEKLDYSPYALLIKKCIR